MAKMKGSVSKEELIGSATSPIGGGSQTSLLSIKDAPESIMGPPIESILKDAEKKFLLIVERGDVNGVKKVIDDYKDRPREFNVNCTDPLGRTALIVAIENESYELVEALLDAPGLKVGDALLHAINEDFVEAVELLLEWEEKNHAEGTPYSWETLDMDNASFTPDITPLILAAHRNNYEILKLLLDRGAALPMPHDVRCGCDECVASVKLDSLRHSRSRINAYRALASPSLIALSSKDPVLTAFELSKELGRLAGAEAEFKVDYLALRDQCQEFAKDLLDHVRSSYELEVMLNYSSDGEDIWEPGDRQTLERLTMAVKYVQKDFVAHSNVQQLLGSIWYEGLPGFRRRTMIGQLIETLTIAAQFPIYAMSYMIAPNSKKGQFLKKSFVKFICHSASYLFFLFLLGLASQRIEYLLIEWFGTDWMVEMMEDWKRHERGSLPGPIELLIILYVFSHVWAEIYSLWSDGLYEYITDLWNIIDFTANMFFLAWIFLRATAWYIVQRESWQGYNPYYPREEWHPFDPMLLSEGMFGAAMIFSFLKTVHVFSVSPHLGPLQVSLGRMIIDIIKFFFIYMLVLFAFGCGLNQLMWYYADLEKNKCYSLPGGLPDLENNAESCFFWRRFANLFETSQSLFWASFGLVDLQSFELTGCKSFTRFWGLLMFGSYSVINVIVLLNMLIAMMSSSYQTISCKADTEWKFARTRLWMSYFDGGGTVPAPFNLFPTPKSLCKPVCKPKVDKARKATTKQQAEKRHMEVMRSLVRRYVTAEQKKSEEMGVTEDDVNEIKQDISTFRFELIDILRQNGMDTSKAASKDHQAAGKKGRNRERRLKKGFQIGMVEDLIGQVIQSEKSTTDVFGKIAKAMANRSSSKVKKRAEWNAAVASRQSLKRNPIGTRETSNRRWSQQSLRRSVVESERAALLSLDPNQLVEYNPRLREYTPATRVAYAKFKSRTLAPVKEKKEKDEKSATVKSGSQIGSKGDIKAAAVVHMSKDAPGPAKPVTSTAIKPTTTTTTTARPTGSAAATSAPAVTGASLSRVPPASTPSPAATVSAAPPVRAPSPARAPPSANVPAVSQASASPTPAAPTASSATPVVSQTPMASTSASPAATLSPPAATSAAPVTSTLPKSTVAPVPLSRTPEPEVIQPGRGNLGLGEPPATQPRSRPGTKPKNVNQQGWL